MADNEERWAMHVDGIKITGYHSEEEVRAIIKGDKKLQAKKAVPVQLSDKIPE